MQQLARCREVRKYAGFVIVGKVWTFLLSYLFHSNQNHFCHFSYVQMSVKVAESVCHCSYLMAGFLPCLPVYPFGEDINNSAFRRGWTAHWVFYIKYTLALDLQNHPIWTWFLEVSGLVPPGQLRLACLNNEWTMSSCFNGDQISSLTANYPKTRQSLFSIISSL